MLTFHTSLSLCVCVNKRKKNLLYYKQNKKKKKKKKKTQNKTSIRYDCVCVRWERENAHEAHHRFCSSMLEQ